METTLKRVLPGRYFINIMSNISFEIKSDNSTGLYKIVAGQSDLNYILPENW